MKNKKLLLTAVALVTVVGGALAFSARQATKLYTIDPLQPEKGCTVPIPFRTLDPCGPVVTHTFVSTRSTTTCQALDFYVCDCH